MAIRPGHCQGGVDQAKPQVAAAEREVERLTIRALVDGEVLQVNLQPGEYMAAPSSEAPIVIGNVEQPHVRVDIDEQDIPRFVPNAPAWAVLKGNIRQKYKLTFVRVDPYVVPKRSLTGDNTERVDTRVLQVIYSLDRRESRCMWGSSWISTSMRVCRAEKRPSSEF